MILIIMSIIPIWLVMNNAGESNGDRNGNYDRILINILPLNSPDIIER